MSVSGRPHLDRGECTDHRGDRTRLLPCFRWRRCAGRCALVARFFATFAGGNGPIWAIGWPCRVMMKVSPAYWIWPRMSPTARRNALAAMAWTEVAMGLVMNPGPYRQPGVPSDHKAHNVALTNPLPGISRDG